jgi:cytochrome c-type biogenesis protein CcmH/NrfG
MANTSTEPGAVIWNTKQVYVMAGTCLLLGLALGYLFRGSETRPGVAAPGAVTQAAVQPAPGVGMQPMPTLEQMKQMADKQAAPLLAKLKDDPKNAALLAQIGKTYEATHQFKDAAGYFEKSLEINPKDEPTRIEMASCMYYEGDVAGALDQLQRSVKDDPASANALFNLGYIRWKGKNDAKGAVAAWEQLLKSNPKLEEAKKSQVEKLIADAQQHGVN